MSAALYRHLAETPRVTRPNITGDQQVTRPQKPGAQHAAALSYHLLQHSKAQHEWSHVTTLESKMTEMPNLYFPVDILSCCNDQFNEAN